MIRSDLLKQIYNVITSHKYLSLEDFNLNEYSNKEGDPCLLIQYRYDKEWLFKFHIPNKKDKREGSSWERYWFSVTMRPGRESIEENIQAEERQGLLHEMKYWLDRLYDDIVAAPLVRRFAHQESEIEKLQSRLDELPDDLISLGDIENFRQSLNLVKEEFTEKLREQTEDKEELKSKIEELSKDIEFLKQTLDVMTKKQWGNMFISRLYKWKEQFSLKQLASGTRVLKLILPPELSDKFDSIADTVENISEIIDKK